MESTPRANRVHIGIYGKCNSGKSSLINAITGQQTAVVSELPGTTTDPVNKSMEVPGLGAVTFIDTAGFDDDSELGERRLEQTRKAADRTDIALVSNLVGHATTSVTMKVYSHLYPKTKNKAVSRLNELLGKEEE